MSRISQDFINDLGFLYEHIHVKDQDFLNEESEYYDEEASELVEDIISTISLSMIYEGFSANVVIGFLADSSEEEIVEKYLNFDESILTESTISKEYIEEQLELLENRLRAAASLGKAAFKTLFGKGPGYAATKLQGPRAPGLIDKAKVLGSKVVNKVKEVGSKAKAALTGPTAKKVALGAAGLGAAGLAGGIGGYVGAKMAGGGKEKSQGSAKPTPSSTKDSTKPTPSAPAASTSSSARSSGASSLTKSTEKLPTPKKPEGATPMQQWAKKYPELAAKVKLGQAGYDEISATRDKPGPSEKKDQTPTTGKPEAKIDTSSVEADIKKEQERLKKKAEQTAVTAKESYDAYDVILEYLIDTEQVDTLEEAHYVMLEMDAETVVDIIEYYINEARVDIGKTNKEKREARRDRNNTSGLDFFHTISRGKKKVKGRKTSYDNEGKMIRKYKTMQDDKRAAQKDQENSEYNERQRVQTRGTWDKD